MKAKLLFLCFIWLLAGCGSDPFIGELKYVLKVEQQGQGKILPPKRKRCIICFLCSQPALIVPEWSAFLEE